MALLPEKLLLEATQGDSAPHANPAKALFVGFHWFHSKLSIPRLGLVQLVRIQLVLVPNLPLLPHFVIRNHWQEDAPYNRPRLESLLPSISRPVPIG